MKREIKILNAVKNHPNIIELKGVVKDPASRSNCLVTLKLIQIFDYLENTDFRSMIPTMTDL